MYTNQLILIVEDNVETNKNIQNIFRQVFSEVMGAYDGNEGWELFQKYQPDALIVDIELPGIKGLELITRIRSFDSECFIGIITAFSNKHNLLRAVTLKLDAFISKPITYNSLNSLVDQIKGFQKTPLQDKVYINQDTTYDTKGKIILYKDNEISLTNLEIVLLEIFLSSHGKILTYTEIEEALYGSEERSRNGLRILVGRLRKKISALNIKTIAQVGYKYI